MKDIQSITPLNLKMLFKVGRIHYDPFRGIGAFGAIDSDYVALMAPEVFLKLVPPSKFVSVDFLNESIDEKQAIGAPFLSVSNSADCSFVYVTGHEGRNRAKACSLKQPHMPIPVFFNVNAIDDITPDVFAKMAGGLMQQRSSLGREYIDGPLFQCFFHGGQRYAVVRQPECEGGFEYSSKLTPYRRNIDESMCGTNNTFSP